MADAIHRQELGIVLPEIMSERRNLAVSAGEKDLEAAPQDNYIDLSKSNAPKKGCC